MPTTRTRTLNVDLDRLFSRAIKIVETVWTLAEMKKAAGIPDEATWDRDLRIHTPGYSDEPDSRELYESDFELKVTRYYDAMTGQELRKVSRRAERTLTHVYFEETYEPIACSVDTGGSGRATQPGPVKAEA